MRVRILSLLLIAGILAGCSKPDPLIGKWTFQHQVEGKLGTGEIEYRKDGTYSEEIRLEGQAKELRIQIEGTWTKPDAGHLKELITDMKWTFEGGPPEMQKELDERIAKQLPTVKEDIAKEPPDTLAWADDDHFTLSDKTETSQYTRKK